MGFNHKLTFWKQKLLIYLRNLVIFFFASSLISVIVYRFVPVYITPLMVIRCVQNAWNGEDVRVLKKWTPIEEMPDYLIKATIVSEDYYFLGHSGIVWDAIKNAYEHNKTHSDVIGGSTISQQTAKNVFLYPRRSYFRKALEAYFTLLIEHIWGKKRIMEVYLNVAETGHGIYGMEMGAKIYFGKKLNELTKSEIASLVALLPSPLTYNPQKESSKLKERKRFIIRGANRTIKVDFENRTCTRKPLKKTHKQENNDAK